jgi:hypothetical protein
MRIFVVGLICSVLFGCDLSLAGKHACRSDKDCLNGRICEEQLCVNRPNEDGGEPSSSEDGDASVEELDAEPASEHDEAGLDDNDGLMDPDAEPAPIEPVTCNTSEDCPADQTCDMTQHLCSGCRANADCRSGRICDRDRERCVECTSHGQCNDGSRSEVRACYAKACTPVECLADEQCASGGCDREFNTCWQCRGNGDCEAGKLCETGSHRCVACIRDSDCGTGWCSGDNQCVAAATCKLWDTFPPSTKLGQLVSTGDGFALADSYQVYMRKGQQWSLYRAAPTTPGAPVITKLVASREFVAAVLEDGTILRGAQASMIEIGRFEQISAVVALDGQLWVATADGKLRMHDGVSWSDLPSAPGAVVGVGESAQGLVIFTSSQGYTLEGGTYRPFVVPTGFFQEVFTLPDGALFVRASDRLYRFSSGQLVLDHPAACAKVAAVFNGAVLIVSCQNDAAPQLVDAYYQRDMAGTWSRVAAAANGTEPPVDGSDVFLGGPIPRTPSGLPARVAALGGRSGRGALIGGPRGVFRIGPGGFRAVPGTSNLDVGALRERPDGAVLSAASSGSRTEVHETASGSDKTLFATEGAFDTSARMTGVAIHGGDDPGQLLYLTTGSPFTITSRQFFYRDSQGWHSDLVDACMLQTGIASFYTAFAAPDIMVTACIGRGVAGVALNGVHEQLADTTSVVSNSPAWLVQLDDPPSVLLWWPGTVPRLRAASGYLPFDLPGEGELRASMSGLRPIGGTRDNVVYYEAKGTLSEFGYYRASAGWKMLTVPFHDLDPTHFWSTDGWASVYAIARGGALLQCRLD